MIYALQIAEYIRSFFFFHTSNFAERILVKFFLDDSIAAKNAIRMIFIKLIKEFEQYSVNARLFSKAEGRVAHIENAAFFNSHKIFLFKFKNFIG